MHVLKIANIPDTRNAGMGRATHATADELRAMGHQVDFLFSQDVSRRQTGAGDRLIFPVALVGAVKQKMRHAGSYDVVEIHEPSAAAYCARRHVDKTLPPCVIMSHGLEANYWQHRLELCRLVGSKVSLKSRILVPLTLLAQARYGLRHCQQVMCLNALDAKFLREQYHLPDEQVTQIVNGVESSFFRERLARTAAPRLLFVGSWLDNKGRQSIIAAFQQVLDKHPALRLSLLGTGYSEAEVLPDFPAATRKAITILPYVDDVKLRAAYAEHDILMFPSFFEGWGLVLLEAAAAGMAIVASRTGGPSEMLTDKQDALMIGRFDPPALGQALCTLVENPQLREELGCKARQMARSYTWRRAAESQLIAYERALENASKT